MRNAPKLKSRVLLGIAGASMAASTLALPALAQEAEPSLAPRPSVETDRRVDERVETLRMACHGRVISTDEGRTKVAHCEWRPATNPRTRGYQLWRVHPERGRKLVWSGGTDALQATVRVPDDAARIGLVLTSVDGHGNLIGRSRLQVVEYR